MNRLEYLHPLKELVLFDDQQHLVSFCLDWVLGLVIESSPAESARPQQRKNNTVIVTYLWSSSTVTLDMNVAEAPLVQAV